MYIYIRTYFILFLHSFHSYSFALLFLEWFGEGFPSNDHYCRSTLLNIGPSAIHQRPNVGLVNDSFLSTASWTCEPIRLDMIRSHKNRQARRPALQLKQLDRDLKAKDQNTEWSTLSTAKRLWTCVADDEISPMHETTKSTAARPSSHGLFHRVWCNSTGGKESQNVAEQLSHAIQPFAMPKNLMPGNLNELVCS